MAGAYDEKIAEWTRGVLDTHKMRSTRQAEARTGGTVNFSTIQNMLSGKRVTEGIVIKFASAFHEDIPGALRVFGYSSMADLWEAGAGIARGKDAEEEETDHNRDEPVDEDEGEVLLYYRGVPPSMKPAAKRFLKSLMEEEDDTDLPTFGKGRKARG